MLDEQLLLGASSVVILTILSIFIFYVPVRWTRKLEDLMVSGKSPKAYVRIKGQKVPPPFPNGWFSIAESSEIVSGAAKSISCLGEDFAVFRSTKDDQVYVLDAFCPHMGANLGVGGIVRDNCIECPFHQWRFNGQDGKLMEIPYSKSLSEIEKTARLKKWKSMELNGLIFVWFHAENAEPWQVPIVNEIESGQWSYHGKNEFMVNCHIQDIPENGADVEHLMAVHSPSILTGPDIRFTRSKLLSIGNHIWNAKWRVDEDNRHATAITLTHLVKIWKYEMIKVVANVKQVGPGYVILYIDSSFGPMVILQTLTPVEPLVQKLCHYFYGPRHLAWFVKFTLLAESINVSRDIMIWNYKKFSSNPLLPKEDKMIKQFRIWFSQFYTENSKSFESSRDDLSW